MFEATYLGHQGWLVESGNTRVLVDPVLADRLSAAPNDPIALYPPRTIDLARFPPVDAVIVTHEHPDHLNLPTLLRLDRAIPIFLPRRSSVAAKTILRELGFTTTLLSSGEVAAVGELEIHPFHSAAIARDEWDVMPVVIRDRAGDGSLATSIDAPETLEFARYAAERTGRVGLWASSHNTMDLFAQRATPQQEPDDVVTSRLARDFRQRFEAQFQGTVRPEVVLILSSGFSFADGLSWMNRHVFPGRADRVVKTLGQAWRDTRLAAPLPGQRLSLKGGRLTDVTQSRPFLAARDPNDWPPHGAEPFTGTIPDYEPASGQRALSPPDRAALLDELRGFAAHLYGGALMRALYEDGARSRGVAFSLRAESGGFTLAYRPEACAFEVTESIEPRTDFTAGLECWATDLLAVLRVELQSGYLAMGHCRTWNAASERLPCDLGLELTMFTHPLRLPDRTLAHYRRTVADIGGSFGTTRVAAAKGKHP